MPQKARGSFRFVALITLIFFFLSLIFPLFLQVGAAIGDIAFQGTVTDPDGNPVEGAYVEIFPANPSSGQPKPDGAGTNASGSYQIVVGNNGPNAGVEYILQVFPPQGSSGYLSPASQRLTYNGSTITVNFQFLPAPKTITGVVKYSDNNNPVANARVVAFQNSNGTSVQTTTNSSGVYTLSVGGGEWEVMPQATSSDNWAYGQPPTRVKFKTDESSESTTVNFTVDRATATIRGTLLKPDGSPVNPQADGVGGVGLFSMEGKGGSGQLDQNGNFSVNVPPGSYMLEVWVSPQSNYGTPSLPPISVKDGETKNLGNLRLVLKNSTITGTVKDENGNGVANLEIGAMRRDGSGFSTATTDSSGNFSIKVTAGKWMVMPFLDPTQPYALNQPPQEVDVASGANVSVSFTLRSATGLITGTVVDDSGNPVAVYGFAFAQPTSGGSFGPAGLGGPVERGSFSFRVPAGSYTVNIGLAPGSNYTPGSGTTVTVGNSETKNITITVNANNATITGQFVDEAGNPVSPSRAEVFAVSKVGNQHSFQMGSISGSSYTISVAAGEWSLGYFIDPRTGYMSSPPDPSMKFKISAGQTITRNIVLKRADATIQGKVYKPDGTPANGVFVSAEKFSLGGEKLFNGAMTDSNGNYSIALPAGTYRVRVNVAPGSGFLSPSEKTLQVSSGQTAVYNFTLRQSNATISGKVMLNGTGVEAFVYAWSDDGGFAQTDASSTGDFSLDVSKNTTWHIGAFYESGTTAYKASEQSVSLNTSSATVNLTLSQTSFSLPQPLTVSFDATKPKIITLSDGTEINIPANSMASSGTITLKINPKVSLPKKKGDVPVWYGYEFTALNSSGQKITKFNSSITITFPYSDSQLAKLGITPKDLIPSYWDETTGTWKKVGNVTVNTTAKTVTITVDHFTNFALLSGTEGSSTTSSSSTTTDSSTSTSSITSTSSAPGKRIADVLAGEGAVVKQERIISILEKGTLPWDSYLDLTKHKKYHPYNIGRYWQVSDIYDVWFKSVFNDAKILYPQKPFILGFKYEREWLQGLPEYSLKLAYSKDEGKTWKILPTSVVDMENRTVAALTGSGGYYMLVAGFVKKGAWVDFGYKKAKVVEKIPTRVSEKVKEVRKPTPSKAPEKEKKPTRKPSLWRRIIDFFKQLF